MKRVGIIGNKKPTAGGKSEPTAGGKEGTQTGSAPAGNGK